MIGQSTLKDYKKVFIQRVPRYAVKRLGGKSWRTKNKPLSDKPILAHLEGKYHVAVLGKWYPEYSILDIDSRPLEEVQEIREMLGLDESTSMLFESESKDSYHILIQPEYHKKPPTLNLLRDTFKNFARSKGIEVYPQKGRPIRLPFGPHQTAIDLEYSGLDSWKKKLYWFEKINPFDLASVKYHQLIFDFEPGPGKLILPKNIFLEAEDFLNHGLQTYSTRHDTQGLILFYLWRQNVPKENAVEIVWDWINEKNNGFSKDILSQPRLVRKDIESQSDFYWNTYQTSQVYPDSTHNLFHGYITKPDLPDIIEVAQGSLPRMKFLFNLVKFSYPRRNRKFISIHTNRLIRWASHRTYQKYLKELEGKGIAERGSSYVSGLYAKDLKLNWRFKNPDEATLREGRAVETFEDTARTLFKPDEFRQLLEKSGTPRRSRYAIINSIWRKG